MPNGRTIPTNRTATVVTWEIKINDQTIPGNYSPDTIGVYQELNRVPMARIVLIDGNPSQENFETSSNELFAPGKKLDLLLGYASENQRVFTGIIIKQSIKLRSQGHAAVILECKHPIIKMSIGRKSKFYEEISDGEVLQDLLSAYQFSADVENTPVLHQLVQYDCTDWDFMLSRAEANALVCRVDADTVELKKPDLSQEPALTLIHGASINELDLETDARWQQKEVITESWNSSDQEMVQSSITEVSDESGGNISISDLAEVAAPENFLLKHGGQLSSTELENWAKAFVLKRNLAKIRGSVKCKGTFEVEPGRLIQLQGVGEVFSGKYLVSAVQHQVSGGDWQTLFQLGLDPDWFTQQFPVSSAPAAGLLPAVQGLQIGLVTDLEDPQSEMRVKVKLPVVQPESEGIWARLATLDAGAERGTFFLPEIGDEVIVGFLHNDPNYAIILGMLHSSAHAAPISAQNDNHIKGYTSRSDLKVHFDDEHKIISISTPDGRLMELNDQDQKITIKDESGNAIVLDPQGIHIESEGKIVIKAAQDIQLEGMNIDTKAQVGFKVQANSQAEINSSGTTVIKGSIVQIN